MQRRVFLGCKGGRHAELLAEQARGIAATFTPGLRHE